MAEALFRALALWPEGLQQGEFWRLWTGHLAHVSWQHLLANLAALFVLLLMGDRRFTLCEVLGLVFVAPLLISLYLLWQRPELLWYAGASGMTHLLLARQCHQLPIGWATVVWGSLLGKLWLETHTTRWLDQSEIVPEAHWAGAALGLLFGLWRLRQLENANSRRPPASVVYCRNARSNHDGASPQASEGPDACAARAMAERLRRRHGQRQFFTAL